MALVAAGTGVWLAARHRRRVPEHEYVDQASHDSVDQASEDSFPASDPPAFNGASFSGDR
ncbi:MAG TPA: hypothetical protein VNE71_03225 [Myxococcota bacterium]|nr:hypothetical protein [Myxococcota bacterium]